MKLADDDRAAVGKVLTDYYTRPSAHSMRRRWAHNSMSRHNWSAQRVSSDARHARPSPLFFNRSWKGCGREASPEVS